MRHANDSIRTGLLCVCATFAALAQPPAKTTAAVPRLVKFSGTLTGSSGQPMSGVVGVTFALYEEERGGAPLWMETQNVQADGNGRYTATLGATRNEGMPAEVFAAGQGRWLGVQPQSEAEQPRVLMTSVPYALKAVDAETLGGLPASAFALAGTGGHALVSESMAASGKPVQPATAASPDQTGSGTANYITIWTAATVLGNSKLYQATSGNVGLGTTTPTAKLEAITASTTGTGVLGDASAATGATFGVTGKSASSTGTGVLGQATAASGANFGVYGATASPAGIAVDGNATTGTGVAGVTSGPTGYGVYGANAATTGTAYGVYGATASAAGIGTLGLATASSGSTFGVYGSTVSSAGFGVEGNATAGTGVAGVTSGPTGYGVYGANAATTGAAYGVYGTTASTAGIGTVGQATAASGTTYGVYGSTVSPAGTAVYGTATGGTGVAGGSSGATGYGVYGANNATSGNAIGVYGNSSSATGIGVSANATAGGTALLAIATGGGTAGKFTGPVVINGNLTVNGTVSKLGGSFRIDHPLDPEHKYLYHSFVESPDMMNIYNGVVTLSHRGDAVVTLPEWFEALNRDFRYQLTCIGGFAPVYVASEVSGNQFKIGGGKAGMKISWQVTGIRKDAFANEHRIPVEENKAPVE
jgi:trimeric autotransporter adhesin